MITLPKDVTVVFEGTRTGDPEKDEALGQRTADADDLDPALLLASVPAPGLHVQDRDVLPGQLVEPGRELAPAVLDREQVVRVAFAGGLVRVGGEHLQFADVVAVGGLARDRAVRAMATPMGL